MLGLRFIFRPAFRGLLVGMCLFGLHANAQLEDPCTRTLTKSERSESVFEDLTGLLLAIDENSFGSGVEDKLRDEYEQRVASLAVELGLSEQELRSRIAQRARDRQGHLKSSRTEEKQKKESIRTNEIRKIWMHRRIDTGLAHGRSRIGASSFGPDGKRLALAGGHGRASLVALEADQETLVAVPINTEDVHKKLSLKSVAFNSDGSSLVLSGSRGRLSRVPLSSDSQLPAATGIETGAENERSEPRSAIEIGNRIYFAVGGDRLGWVEKVGDPKDWKAQYLIANQGDVVQLALSKGSGPERLFVSGYEGTVHWIDLTKDPSQWNLTPIETHGIYGGFTVSALVPSSDGKRLIAMGGKGAIGMVDLTLDPKAWEAKLVISKPHENSWIGAAALSPDDKFLFLAGFDGKVSIVDLRGPPETWAATRLHVAEVFGTKAIYSVHVSPDNRHLLLTGDEGAAAVWNLPALLDHHGFSSGAQP